MKWERNALVRLHKLIALVLSRVVCDEVITPGKNRGHVINTWAVFDEMI